MTEDDIRGPRTRGDCIEGPRPCPHIACRYHLALEVAGKEVRAGDPTCTLDLADLGGITLEEVGQALHVTRERVRQIERIAMLKLKAAAGSLRDFG